MVSKCKGEEKMYENKVRERVYDGAGMVYGFFVGTGMFTMILCLMIAALLLTGCGKGSSVPTLPPPPPPQDQYEALPATHQFVLPDGKTVGVWATMFPVSPLRGSTIPIGGSCGSGGCFKVPMEVRSDEKEGTRIRMDFFLSRNGVSEDETDGYMTIGAHETVTFTSSRYSVNFPPKYLLIKATIQGKTASTNFFLDYR